MEIVKQLETTIEGWLKPVPHLPADWRKWLSENVWWLVIISVVVTAYAMVNIYQAATALDSLRSYLSYFNADVSSGWSTSMMVSMALLAVSTVVMVMAISPLKEHKKRGWDLLFIATLVSVLSTVASSLVMFNVGNLISSLIGAAIGGAIGMYLLFEIRSHFNGATVIHKSK